MAEAARKLSEYSSYPENNDNQQARAQVRQLFENHQLHQIANNQNSSEQLRQVLVVLSDLRNLGLTIDRKSQLGLIRNFSVLGFIQALEQSTGLVGLENLRQEVQFAKALTKIRSEVQNRAPQVAEETPTYESVRFVTSLSPETDLDQGLRELPVRFAAINEAAEREAFLEALVDGGWIADETELSDSDPQFNSLLDQTYRANLLRNNYEVNDYRISDREYLAQEPTAENLRRTISDLHGNDRQDIFAQVEDDTFKEAFGIAPDLALADPRSGLSEIHTNQMDQFFTLEPVSIYNTLNNNLAEFDEQRTAVQAVISEIQDFIRRHGQELQSSPKALYTFLKDLSRHSDYVNFKELKFLATQILQPFYAKQGRKLRTFWRKEPVSREETEAVLNKVSATLSFYIEKNHIEAPRQNIWSTQFRELQTIFAENEINNPATPSALRARALEIALHIFDRAHEHQDHDAVLNLLQFLSQEGIVSQIIPSQLTSRQIILYRRQIQTARHQSLVNLQRSVETNHDRLDQSPNRIQAILYADDLLLLLNNIVYEEDLALLENFGSLLNQQSTNPEVRKFVNLLTTGKVTLQDVIALREILEELRATDQPKKEEGGFNRFLREHREGIKLATRAALTVLGIFGLSGITPLEAQTNADSDPNGNNYILGYTHDLNNVQVDKNFNPDREINLHSIYPEGELDNSNPADALLKKMAENPDLEINIVNNNIGEPAPKTPASTAIDPNSPANIQTYQKALEDINVAENFYPNQQINDILSIDNDSNGSESAAEVYLSKLTPEDIVDETSPKNNALSDNNNYQSNSTEPDLTEPLRKFIHPTNHTPGSQVPNRTGLYNNEQPEDQPETQPEDQPETQPEDQPETQPEDQPETQPEVIELSQAATPQNQQPPKQKINPSTTSNEKVPQSNPEDDEKYEEPTGPYTNTQWDRIK